MRLFLLCLVVAWTLGLRAGSPAHGQQALAVAVWQRDRDDGALKDRIEGQTADLPVVLLPLVRDGAGLTARERLAAAGALLQESGARALVYWEPSPLGGRRLRVLSGERVFSRELGGEGADEPVRSATLESAAVVVRAVLRTLLAGEQTGVSLSTALVESEPEAAAEPSPAPVAPAPSPPRRPGLLLSLGWQGTLDGQSPPGQHALSLSLGIVASRLLIRLWLHGGIPAALDDGLTRVALSRHGFALGLLGAAVRLDRLRLLGGVLAGLCGYYRTTESLSADYEATQPSFTPALCVAPQLGLWLRPSRRAPLYLELFAAAEVVVGRPRLGYADASGFVPRGELWAVQPALGLALVYLRERPPAATTPAPQAAR
ncbi:MAG: hypothetical protein U1A78_26100 [Polyangia bacterium]